MFPSIKREQRGGVMADTLIERLKLETDRVGPHTKQLLMEAAEHIRLLTRSLEVLTKILDEGRPE
jgi:hypothetical protein